MSALALLHRDYAALIASVPAIAVGSIAFFMLKDYWSATAGSEEPTWSGAHATSLRPDEELALTGIVLAAMAQRLEHDPAGYPLLACAAARLVPDLANAAGWRGWTGLTERARRAAVDVLRPTALSVLVRAATWGLVQTGDKP